MSLPPSLGATIHVVPDPILPKGTFLLLPHGMTPVLSPDSEIEWKPWPWDPSPMHWTQEARDARYAALEHLSRLLDDLSEFAGQDPMAWRVRREQRRDHHTWMASQRLAMTIDRPEGAFVVVP